MTRTSSLHILPLALALAVSFADFGHATPAGPEMGPEVDTAASAARLDGQGRVVLSFEAAPERPRHKPAPAIAATLPELAARQPGSLSPLPGAPGARAPRVAHKGAGDAWTPALAVALSRD